MLCYICSYIYFRKESIPRQAIEYKVMVLIWNALGAAQNKITTQNVSSIW